ncbi:hypothetical protein J5069_02830 [Candidatus Symbiopectobacterium sp. NZEC127]|uniref:hypothetical protein n=1 Tax=Candidatus Symbiopectobacterium sp. NZEC127 TaxID=2820472 RepID=UPI0022273F6A|nr:hypothetical protein [Candidatus Symbiopectobacterium sp. NZEC127]MCW2484825.1 hypothetical protein [Candidatus Symbiopectobacterium sp. NZEC127]
MEDESTFRIKFAFYHSNWEFGRDSVPELKATGRRVLPSEFTMEMRHHIFCPECSTPLSRRPQNKDKATDGRNPSFAHLPSFISIPCGLRAKTAIGKQYKTEEDAKKAIEDEELAIIDSFMKDPPEIPNEAGGIYDQNHVEDIDGEISDVPIGRHRGESFKLPSKITTVAGMCRNFDKNYYKYFVFPGEKNAERLDRIIKNINEINDVTHTPRLYFGVIKFIRFLGERYNSLSTVMLKWDGNEKYIDLSLKMPKEQLDKKNITDDKRKRIILIYGIVNKNGKGLCFEHLGWGEYALLPQVYDDIIID